MGFLKATILLSDGKNHCPYINKDFMCNIYEHRPSICKSYPLSTNIDNAIYFDLNCPAISLKGIPLIKNGIPSDGFNSFIFDDYQTKYINTHNKLEIFNDKNDFELITSINNNHFYKYIGSKKSQYIDFHLKSLKNLNKYNL